MKHDQGFPSRAFTASLPGALAIASGLILFTLLGAAVEEGTAPPPPGSPQEKDGKPASEPPGPGAPSPPRWWRGNTHTHTLNSDGDSSPGEVAHWYRDNGYDFLVLSDHNYYTVIDELQRELDREHARGKEKGAKPRRRLLLIPGEEVTDSFEKAEIHVNAFGSLKLVGPRSGASKKEVLQRNIDAILAAGGVPSVNHPNFAWSLTAEDLAALQGLKHFEIYNGHPGVHNFGGGGTPSCEDLWDDLLSRGVRIFGIAVDDAHDYRNWSARDANPGRGWIMVRAPELSTEAIRGAFESGDFYASTGVSLSDVRRGETSLEVEIEKDGNTRFTTFFIGARGRVLQKETGLVSSHTLRTEEAYVRVKVASSRGEYAWTQPFFQDAPR
jgi:hypothetical protein